MQIHFIYLWLVVLSFLFSPFSLSEITRFLELAQLISNIE